jgi:predicted lipoprotein with Yx(FWY)xxD motif
MRFAQTIRDRKLRDNGIHLRWSRTLVAVAVAAVAASCLFASGAAGAGSAHAPFLLVKVLRTRLGPTLVTQKGQTLYLLTSDERAKGKSTCYGTCAKFWPPLLATGMVKAGPGARQALLGRAKRTGGAEQVTYRGHRLYRFVKDKKPGQFNGEGIRGYGGPVCTAGLARRPCVWYAVSTSGRAITFVPKSTTGKGTRPPTTTTTTTASTTTGPTTTTTPACNDSDNDGDQSGGGPDDGDGCL